MPLWLKILVCIIAAEILGGLGGFLTASSIGTWYADLDKPPGTPPNWVFGPVWTVLYAMMGTAFALVWHRRSRTVYQHVSEELRVWGPDFDETEKKSALTWFAIQLVLNLAWTPVFFGAHQMLAALIIILALLAAIGITIRKFRPLNRVAAGLLVPYAIWVSYATWLNAGYWWLNR